MTEEVVTVEPENTLRDVIEVLSSNEVSAAPVVSGGRVIGVISKSDILDFLASTPGVPSARVGFSEWGEIESPEEEDEDADESMAFYTDLWDDAGADVVERFLEPEAPEWDLLNGYTASSLMTRRIEALSSDASVAEAARQLLERKVHRLIVLDGSALRGIVSMTDLVRLIATERLPENGT
jgi:CBS domain-containing protein